METAELILTKAFDLFKRYGIRSVTMDDIASHCGISKKTLYQAFSDKDTLVGTIVEQSLTRSSDQCCLYRQESDNAIHEIFQSIDMFQQMFDGVSHSMIYDLKKYHQGVFKKVEDHKQQFLYSITRANLERGIAEGIFRADINVEIITQFHLMSMLNLFEDGQFPLHKLNLVEVQVEIMLHYLYGISNAKGVKLIEKYKQQRQKQKP